MKRGHMRMRLAPRPQGPNVQPNRFHYHVYGVWTAGSRTAHLSQGVTTNQPITDEREVKQLQDQIAAQILLRDAKSGAVVIGERATFAMANFILLRAWYEKPAEDETTQAEPAPSAEGVGIEGKRSRRANQLGKVFPGHSSSGLFWGVSDDREADAGRREGRQGREG